MCTWGYPDGERETLQSLEISADFQEGTGVTTAGSLH